MCLRACVRVRVYSQCVRHSPFDAAPPSNQRAAGAPGWRLLANMFFSLPPATRPLSRFRFERKTIISFCFVNLGAQPRACVSLRGFFWVEGVGETGKAGWWMLDKGEEWRVGGGRLATRSCLSQWVATMTVARQEPSNKDIRCYFPLLVCRHFSGLQPLLCMCVCARTFASTPVSSTGTADVRHVPLRYLLIMLCVRLRL